MDAARKQDRGEEVRTVASTVKVFGTEMAREFYRMVIARRSVREYG